MKNFRCLTFHLIRVLKYIRRLLLWGRHIPRIAEGMSASQFWEFQQNYCIEVDRNFCNFLVSSLSKHLPARNPQNYRIIIYTHTQYIYINFLVGSEPSKCHLRFKSRRCMRIPAPGKCRRLWQRAQHCSRCQYHCRVWLPHIPSRPKTTIV